MAPVFCNGCGKRAKEFDNFCDGCGDKLRKTWEEEVDCSPYIDQADIAQFLNNYSDRLVNEDRRLLQEALVLITSENQWVWRHAKVSAYGMRVTAVFYSGDKTNKFVVRLNSENRPIHEVEEKGWRLWFRDEFLTVWGWIKDATQAALSIISAPLFSTTSDGLKYKPI